MKTSTTASRRSGPIRTRNSLALAVLVALCSSAAVNASAATSGPSGFATVAHSTSLRHGDALMGPLQASQPIHVEVAVKMRDRAGLDASIANNAKNASKGIAQQLMTPEEFLAKHAPTQLQAQAVADYLTRSGFTNVVIAPNRLLVSADGTATTARNAFLTTFAQVRTYDGRIAFMNTDDVLVPAGLQDSVVAVLGLQTVHQAHTFVRRAKPASVHANAIVGHDPLEFSSIYGGTGVATGEGVVVGIITEGNLAQTRADLTMFAANNGLATPVTQTITTNGSSGDVSHIDEWDLDSQDMLGMAGGQLGRMIFYNIPSLVDSNLTADFNTAVAANQAKIINVSLGLCETDEKADGAAAAQDQILAQGVAQGQTFAVATGDAGANECDSAQIAPNWPSSSQYVIAVGGTDLSASTTTWEDETAWIDGGGGPSTFEPRPSWQVVEEGNEPTVLRGTPDLAFDADPGSGAIIVYKGLPTRFGGTSLSAPLFAGMWARVIRVKGTSAGFAGPLIYPIADDFHDIRVGNNGFYSAGLGYDYATGLGSLILNKAINDIPPLAVVPPVANFSFITSGLSVDFTDSSVSSKGTIVSNTWQFGDGGTSSVSAPSHTYAAAGTYKVTETVVDSLGHSSSKTQSVKVTTTVGTQLLQNTSFEDGVAPWSMQPDVIVPDFPVEAHSGTAFANIGQESLTEHVAQSVAIPAGKTSATLGFYMWVQTDETTTTKVDDKLDVEVYGSTGALLATLATYSNLDVSNAYVVHTFDMTPYIGQTVSIRFVGTNNATLPTYWLLDDVTLTVQ